MQAPAKYIQPHRPDYSHLIRVMDDFMGHVILAGLVVAVIGIIEMFTCELGIPKTLVECMGVVRAVGVAIIGAHGVFITCCALLVTYDSL